MSEKNLPLYRVRDWDAYFENAKSRTIDKCAYLVSPNKHGGSGWSEVMGEEDGAAIWGIWKMILDLCSRQRKQREGWLTDNGKNDGRRLSARNLSNQFRRPIGEIHRCLQVMSDPAVGFIELVEGQPEHIGEIPHGQAEDTGVPVEPLSLDRQPTATAVSAEYPPTVSAPDTLRRKEGKKEPPIVPQRGTSENGQEKGRQPAPDRHPKDTEEPLQYAEAETWLNGLFGRKKAWQAKELHALAEVLPIARDHQRLLAWGYSLERDGDGWAVYEGTRLTKPKQSLTALLEDFNGEIDKWTAARKQAGLNGLFDHHDQPKPEAADGWTPARRQAFVTKFGDDRQFPENFSELGASACRQIDELASKGATTQ